MADFNGKVAVITGASSGIGKGIATHLASLKCSLTLCGRNEDNLNGTKQLCIEKGLADDQILTLVGDVSSEEYCQKLITKTVDKFEKLDILVNNAGIGINGGVQNTKLSDFDEIMNVNVRSVFHLTQLAIPHLKKTKGNIVNISSVAGLRAFPDIVAYCMTKAAIDQLTRCVALEVANDGVRVNAVNPGVVLTEIQRRSGISEEQYAGFLEKCKTMHPMGRPGTVDEVAQSVAFLASDASSFTTGVTLSVDGGRCHICPR